MTPIHPNGGTMIDRDDCFFAATMLAISAFWLFAVIGIVWVAS